MLLSNAPADGQPPVAVRRHLPESAQLENQCDALYLGILKASQQRQLLTRLAGLPILSIAESADACSDGSLFCLRIGEETTSFAVNLDAIARSGIRVHPQVLQLGRRSRPQP